MANNRLDLVHFFISADNETKLQEKLYKLSLDTAKLADVIAIYPKGSKVIAWVRLDKKYVEFKVEPIKDKTPIKKKVTKRKVK